MELNPSNIIFKIINPTISNIIFKIINPILGIFILISYFFILVYKNDESYFTSKYWLGVSKKKIASLIPFQILAGIGIITWYVNMIITPPDKGILQYTILNIPMYDILICLCLFGSILWPLSLLQEDLIENKTIEKSLLCCLGLFIAAIAGILMHAGSFEADNVSWISLLGITFFNITVVLNDGIGWSARLLHQTIYK